VTRIGYVQVGVPQHGICRYGRALAREARRRPELSVVEENLELTGERAADRRRLEALGADVGARVELVHLQISPWGDGSWGAGFRARENLAAFRRGCRVPLAITLHDVNGLASQDCGRLLHMTRSSTAELLRGLRPSGIRFAKQLLRGNLRREDLLVGYWNWRPLAACAFARAATRAAAVLLVITDSERKLLSAARLRPDAVLIPHFVDDVAEPGPSAPKPAGVPKTLIVAGFIFHSKGHELVVEAMVRLPDVRVVFVGGKSLAGFETSHFARLMDLARERGVHDRLEVTGYLPESEYRQRLAEADLAVCPFDENKSASGSLSSLIASGVPVLASDIPLIAEYNALVPGAIPTFAPRTAEALATAVRRALATPRSELTQGLEELRKRLSLAAVYDRHLAAYAQALEGRA